MAQVEITGTKQGIEAGNFGDKKERERLENSVWRVLADVQPRNFKRESTNRGFLSMQMRFNLQCHKSKFHLSRTTPGSTWCASARIVPKGKWQAGDLPFDPGLGRTFDATRLVNEEAECALDSGHAQLPHIHWHVELTASQHHGAQAWNTKWRRATTTKGGDDDEAEGMPPDQSGAVPTPTHPWGGGIYYTRVVHKLNNEFTEDKWYFKIQPRRSRFDSGSPTSPFGPAFINFTLDRQPMRVNVRSLF
ncbi:hypothetical protein C8R44DRAFT_733239 [Mycena epipterygia]|nr:hypothetical protein C8R44DRAFT_733239 [Mycena epipterygia]